jgi:hypothetical protein
VRSVEFSSRDRLGNERVQRALVYGGVSRTGLRTLLIELTDPADLRGLAVLVTERDGANHVFVSPAGLPDVKQVRGATGQSSLFGTDFSYEDIERLYGLTRPGETHKLGRSETPLDGRPFWLLETTPAAEAGSNYRRVVSLVDQETCVLLRAEMYEAGPEPRKVLTSDFRSVTREGSTWVARDVLLRDMRDQSQTRMRIDAMQVDTEHRGIPFTPEELEQYKRGVGSGP